MRNLEDLLPIFGVEQESILSKQGDITLAYEVSLPELFTLSDNEYESLHQSLIKAIKVLPVGYSSRQVVQKTLSLKEKETLFETLKKITNQQYSYLIRMALAGKSDCKYPRNDTGIALYKTAEGAGINVAEIEKQQKEKADERSERMKERVKDLQKRKGKLNSERTAPKD